jgi:hypothetical protein
MNEIFHDFIREGFVVVYLDDVLIFSRDEEEHYAHLRKVFQRLREKELFAKLAKCEFLCSELKYLGHIIGKDGLKVDPQKMEVVKNWPTPQNVTDVRRFLGLANYFRKFIQGFSSLAAPLTKLSSSKSSWTWGKEQDEALAALKDALIQAPILSLPDLRKPFQVICDASDFGVGAVLLQEGRVIAYYSKKLNSAERNYSATERELLAVVYALTEWRCYVMGKQVTVTTDHKCNTFLQQQAGLSPRRARWAEKLQEFNILWVWEPGKTNVADALSRNPVLQGQLQGQHQRNVSTEPNPGKGTNATSMDGDGRARSGSITLGSDGCDTFLELLKGAYAHDSWLGTRANRRKVHFTDGVWEFGREGRKYVPAFYEVRDKEGPVARNLRQDILKALHEPPSVGHPGFAKMYDLVKRDWWWPGMADDVRDYVKYCDSCQRVKASNQLPAGLLHPLQIPTRKWQSISMDFITGLPKSKHGHNAIWVVVDRLSKCAHFAPTTTNADAYEVAVLMRDKVWKYHGFPEAIVSDRDPRFVNNFMNTLLSLTGCKPARTTAYHPQSDGQTKRVNRILEDFLKHYVKDNLKEWEDYLSVAEFAYNNSWQASLNSTPFRLTYGQDPNIPFAVGHMEGTKVDRADLVMRKMQDKITLARKCLHAAQDRQAAYANRHRREAIYQEGDYVLLSTRAAPTLTSNRFSKLQPRHVGPFRVMAATPDNVNFVTLDLPDRLDIHPRINVCYLKPYWTREEAQSRGYCPPKVITKADGTTHMEWVVDALVDHRLLHDQDGFSYHYEDGTPFLEYLVKWAGHGATEDSWESQEAFETHSGLVNTYHRLQGLAPPIWDQVALRDTFP